MYRNQNAGRIRYIKIVNSSFEKVEQFKYLGTDILIYLPTYLLTYLLTHSMVQNPSTEANWFAASQEIPRISRNPKVHYRTHKRPSPVSILGQPNPVHIPISYLLEIHSNIHLPLGLPSGLFPSGFPTKTLYTPLNSPIRATCPAHLIHHDVWCHTVGNFYHAHGISVIYCSGVGFLFVCLSELMSGNLCI